MLRLSRRLVEGWADLGTRFLPFADAATPDVPLSRLLRLSLFQVSCGMAMVLLMGTLNRVMIVELHVSAALVAIMVSLPIVFAPLRAVIGFKSDTHRSALGWKRVPFIWRGSMVQFGGFAVMPFALLVLAGAGADRGALVAFILAWSLNGFQKLLVYEAPLLGLDFALLRTLITFPMPMIAGWIARRVPIAWEPPK